MQATVVIVDSTEPGRLGFADVTLEVPVTAPHVLVPVVRRNGADGHVNVKYRTEAADASAGVLLACCQLCCRCYITVLRRLR